MITLLADFTNEFPARPFAGSVASAVQLGNAVAVPATRKAELRIAPETIRYATFRIFSSIFTVSFGASEGRKDRLRTPSIGSSSRLLRYRSPSRREGRSIFAKH